jgi:diamine N-acetyltransferase
MAIEIRAASAASVAASPALAARLFAETFAADNRPEDMAAYLTSAFGEGQQAAELADPANRVWLAVAPDGSAAGYALLRLGSAPADAAAGASGHRPAELARLDVDQRWHGAGIARALMDACVDAARAAGADALWLGVWERNARAIAFYEKCGFARVGTQTFRLGSDTQTDHVMAKALGG